MLDLQVREEKNHCLPPPLHESTLLPPTGGATAKARGAGSTRRSCTGQPHPLPHANWVLLNSVTSSQERRRVLEAERVAKLLELDLRRREQVW